MTALQIGLTGEPYFEDEWWESAPLYTYAWGNNSRRAVLKGRPCVIEATGKLGTALVRFVDNGERVTTSRRALRKVAYAA